jgi:hypothetical protein
LPIVSGRKEAMIPANKEALPNTTRGRSWEKLPPISLPYIKERNTNTKISESCRPKPHLRVGE